MLIYNTTYLVSDKVYGVWFKWVKEYAIPYMTESGHLIQPQIAKVLLEDKSQEGISVTLQVKVRNNDILERWNAMYEAELHQNCFENFGTEVLFFSTVLEILD